MRAAIVYKLSERGGVQSCVLALIQGLNRLGVTPDILWDEPPSPELLKGASAEAGFRPLRFRFSSASISRLPNAARYLAWIGNYLDGAALRAYYDCFFSFYNGFLTPAEAPHVYYLSGPPLLPQLEAPQPGLRTLPFRFCRLAYRAGLRRRWPAYEYHRDRNYVINSQFTAQLFREAHGVSLPVVYPAIDLTGRQFEAADIGQRDTLLFFSRILVYKRPELFLELARRHPEFRCVVMGGVAANRQSYFEALRKQTAQNHPSAVFLANPSAQSVRQELARARFYVFPAINEHFGMTTPEAIASGAIPFVHDSGGQREIVTDERLRFQDPVFFEKFARLAALPDVELNRMREALNAHVAQFSSDVFVSKLLAYVPKLQHEAAQS